MAIKRKLLNNHFTLSGEASLVPLLESENLVDTVSSETLLISGR